MNNLKNKMGDMNCQNILMEKSDLIQKHTNTIKAIAQLKGQAKTLEVSMHLFNKLLISEFLLFQK